MQTQHETKSYMLPNNAQGVGMVQNKSIAVIMGFAADREIITHIGYMTPNAEPRLKSYLNALCDLMRGKPTISAGLSHRDELLHTVNGTEMPSKDDEMYIAASELALLYALMDHSSKLNNA